MSVLIVEGRTHLVWSSLNRDRGYSYYRDAGSIHQRLQVRPLTEHGISFHFCIVGATTSIPEARPSFLSEDELKKLVLEVNIYTKSWYYIREEFLYKAHKWLTGKNIQKTLSVLQSLTQCSVILLSFYFVTCEALKQHIGIALSGICLPGSHAFLSQSSKGKSHVTLFKWKPS